MQAAKLNGLVWIIICYMLALAGAWTAVLYVEVENVILKTFLADVTATAIVFAFSTVLRNASFYDAYWSVAPVPIAVYWKYHYAGKAWFGTEIIVLCVIIWWSLRLTLNWYRGWQGLQHEDWRYQALRTKTGQFFPAVNFLGIHLFPTVMVFLGCLPILAVFRSEGLRENFQFFLFAGLIFGFAAPVIQFFADEQMRTHRKNPNHSHINSGIWKYSRHPNYFGEILFWFALGLIGFSFSSFEWWMASGFVAMTLMFVFISVPLMEKRIVDKYPGYKEQQENVAMLIPWRRKH